ncbi:MAG: ABC transporter ATP-binding protein [Flavobacteriales bacterium]|nr:ABC transporter ATP-binding protein [Flavobacteriales bacterium]
MDRITPVQRLLRLLRLDKREIGHIYLYALVGGAISLSVPLGIQAIINLISGGQVATSWGVLIAFVTVGVALTGVMQIMQLSLAENIQQRLFARSAIEFAYRIPRIKEEAVAGRYLPELTNRFFDTMSVQKGLNKLLLDVPLALLQILLSLVLLALYHPFFIVFGLFLVFLLYLMFRFTGARGLVTSLEESNYKFAVAHWLEELGRTVGTFKLIGETPLSLDRTDHLVHKYVSARKAHFRVLLGQYSAMVVFKVVITLSLLALGGILVMEEQMNLGQFVAAEIVVLLLMAAVEKVILSIESVYDVLSALEKIGLVTDLPLDRTDGIHVLDTDRSKGLEVRLDHVSFRSHWNQRTVLDHVDIHLKPGEKVALCGPNGAGKSTVLRLIGGALDPHAGDLRYDGHPVNSIDLEQVRSLIGESLLADDVFAGTVLENITVGRTWISDMDVDEAAKVTGLYEQLADLPQGMLTRLDPQGSRLPSSLVRRIVLTRCIASKPRMLLLEDGSTDWDKADRDRLLSYIASPERPWTLLAVTNDPGFQALCTRVIRLENGRIVSDSHA